MSDSTLEVLNDNLKTINRNVTAVSALLASEMEAVRQGIGKVEGRVEEVSQLTSATRDELSQLANAFHEFRDADRREKRKIMAQGEIVEVRQIVQQRFGRYQEIRDLAVGLLQAIDTKLVRSETLRFASEERMTYAKQYWLGPAVVALSAWFDDKRELADRAIAETVRRDDNKASLFFALVARRAGRRQAGGAWLRRFFSLQDPTALG